jgi:hypothetical protein
MINAQPTPSSAAAHAPACRPLELLEARKQRDTLKSLLRAEQSAMADFLIALADFDACRGWEPLGYSGLFAFLHVELQLSRSATFWRFSAARLVQRFPQVIEPLRDGRLCLSTTAELSKVLTEQNLDEVLPRYFHLSAREAAEVTAELQPREQPPLRTVVSLLAPAPRSMVTAPVAPEIPGSLTILPAHVEPSASARTVGPVPTSELVLTHPARAVNSRDDVEPLTAELRRLHVTVSRQFLDELESARDGLSHAIPNASTEQVLREGLRMLLEKQARARALLKRPRNVAPNPNPTPTSTTTSTTTEPPPHRREGHRAAIPAAVKRAVWQRDGGRCQWPLDGGGRCGSTHRPELDHIVPWADRGGETEANLRVVCAAHNRLAARQAFGERVMGKYVGRRAGGSG